jgi:hypothetical protein
MEDPMGAELFDPHPLQASGMDLGRFSQEIAEILRYSEEIRDAARRARERSARVRQKAIAVRRNACGNTVLWASFIPRFTG